MPAADPRIGVSAAIHTPAHAAKVAETADGIIAGVDSCRMPMIV